MFKVTINGDTHHEPANGRTPEELQHHLTTADDLKFVRVREWIRAGARGPIITKLEEPQS